MSVGPILAIVGLAVLFVGLAVLLWSLLDILRNAPGFLKSIVMKLLAEHRPGWMSQHEPQLLAEHRPGWMSQHEPQLLAEHRPELMAHYRPKWMVEHKPEWVEEHLERYRRESIEHRMREEVESMNRGARELLDLRATGEGDWFDMKIAEQGVAWDIEDLGWLNFEKLREPAEWWAVALSDDFEREELDFDGPAPPRYERLARLFYAGEIARLDADED